MARSKRFQYVIAVNVASVAAVAAVAAWSGGSPAWADPAAATDQQVLFVGDSPTGNVDSWNGPIQGPGGVLDPTATLSAPSILSEPDRTLMWFCDKASNGQSVIGLKVSDDAGVTWHPTTSFTLAGTPGGSDGLGTCDPSVVRFGTYYYMVYQAQHGPYTQLYAARASATGVDAGVLPWSELQWEKWTGSGWLAKGSPAALDTGQLDATAPSLVVRGGVLSIFYTQPGAAQQDQLRVLTTPLADGWPVQTSAPHTVLTLHHLASPLQVRFDDASGQFVAVSASGSGAVGYATSGTSDQFAPIPVDDNDQTVDQGSNLTLAADASGHLGGFATYSLPGAPGTVRLHRASVRLGTLPTGNVSSTFNSFSGWDTYSTDATQGWFYDSSRGGALYGVRQSQGAAVGRAWEGDGLYQLTLHSAGDVDLDRAGLQVGRQSVHQGYLDSGYTVLVHNNALELYEAGQGLIGQGANIPSSIFGGFPGVDPHNLTINILKTGAILYFWPSWPGNANLLHQYGASITELHGPAWGAGHPAAIVDHSTGWVRPDLTVFDKFVFTPLSSLTVGPGGVVTR